MQSLSGREYTWDKKGKISFTASTADIHWGSTLLEEDARWRVVTAAYAVPAGGECGGCMIECCEEY